MSKEIDKSTRVCQLQVMLNKPENLPPKAYRRDFGVYELVCYVNNIIACHIAGHDDPIEILSQRAKGYMEKNNCPENRKYYDIVLEYLKELDGLE